MEKTGQKYMQSIGLRKREMKGALFFNKARAGEK